MDFKTLDNNGDSCLSLACMRGFGIENENDDVSLFLLRRKKLIEIILLRSNLDKTVLPGMNNPLHWCMYYGDVIGGSKIFNKKPSLNQN